MKTAARPVSRRAGGSPPAGASASLRLAFLPLVVVGLVVSLGGCSGEAESPEARVRALIERAEQAAEHKEGRVLRGLVADAYLDAEGRDKRAVEGVLRLVLLRHEAIHLLTRISEIALPAPGRARAVVYVAMAGRPIAGPAQLAALRASLWRFELDLIEEDGDWRVASAAWRRAEPADFIYQP
jgi:hypothetical protein